jgi:GT2 family glycosyltransferase
MKTCAIVILNYNGEKVLPEFLPSVVHFSEYDIWVIDNGSEDKSLLLLEDKFPEVNLIRLNSNFGFAGGYNWGLEELKGQYDFFILLNSDVEVSSGWDVKLISWLEKKSDYGVVQPKILSWQDRRKFDYAGAGGGFLDGLGYPYCRGRVLDTIENDSGQYDDEIEVDWASGACLAIKAGIFFETGGFDAHFFAHMEEIDLCWRIKKSGRKIGYIGEVVVYHQGGATLSRTTAKKLYLNIRNNLSMLYKNLPFGRFVLVFIQKILLEGIAAFRFFLTGEKEFAKAIVLGYKDFFSGRKFLAKTQFKEKVLLEVPRRGSVENLIWNYMVLGKKKFSEF